MNKEKTKEKKNSSHNSCFIIRDSTESLRQGDFSSSDDSSPIRIGRFPSSDECSAHKVRGFSIIETVVAIAVLSVAMVAPLTLAQRGLNSSIYARDQVTAFYLAQEAIEYVHYIRDSNNLKGRSQSVKWLSERDDASKVWGLDVTLNSGNYDSQIIDCTGNLSACLVTFNESNGIYGSQSGPAWRDTHFTRTFSLSRVSIGSDPFAQAEIVVTVSWPAGLITRNVVIKEKIFNWFPAQF